VRNAKPDPELLCSRKPGLPCKNQPTAGRGMLPRSKRLRQLNVVA